MPDLNHADRRRRLMQAVGEDAVAVLPAAAEQIRNRDVHYPFRQDSDFSYLTGFPEPDAVAVLAPGREEGEFLLFCRPRDPERELWDGYRAGPEGAMERYGADQAENLERLDELMPKLLDGRETVYYALGGRPDFDDRLVGWLNRLKAQVRSGARAPERIASPEPLLHEMRLIKSAAELQLMRQAARTSVRAHCRAMRNCAPGLYEYQLAADIRHEFERAGMEPAYPSIVGGGANACILHYVEKAAALQDGDLVLIDAGAEYAGYCADITRSFPVNGRYSQEQRALYEVVLAAQRAAIDQVRTGNPYNAPHDAAVRVLTEGLLELGLLQGDVDELIENETYKRFYMHNTGHWLGMDVHDVGVYKIEGEWRKLEPGMTLTVEPGLYIAADAEDVDARFRGTGIRIEDDVLVTEGDPEVLTADAPKQIDEVEALMAG